MIVKKLDEFFRGWFIGDFEPALLRTKDFEVGVLKHEKGEEWAPHYHTATEINYIISGQLKMHERVLTEGDIFVMEPYEVANPEFLTDCQVLVIKTPSIPGDKYLAEKPDNKERLL